MTRRDFVRRVGRFGGAAATGAMATLDLLGKPGRTTAAQALPPPLPTGPGKTASRVLILGAGLCGMSAAYELGKSGFRCEIFEARARSGGRCWTVRGGDRQTETGGAEQTARFDAGFYLNPGPARIPGHHTTTLAYCRELGVPVEVFNNVNESAYYLVRGVPRVRLREARADLRGYVDELLAKAVRRDALDRPLTADDKEALVEYLRADGGLSPDLFYKPSPGRASLGHASGGRGYEYDDLPAAGDHPGHLSNPLDFETVIKAGFGRHLNFEHQFDQQPTMFQPVGGMDQIAKALEKKVGSSIRFQTEVREIRRTAAGGVRLVVADLLEGTTREVTGDHCICTVPLSVLRDIPADWSPPVADAIRQVPYMDVGKIGLQFRRRFWEEDDRVYGGISWTDQNITQLMYPNYGYLGGGGGVVVGYYHFADDAKSVGLLSPAGREAHALAQGTKIHPQYLAEFQHAFSVAWQRIPYSLGGWAEWNESMRADLYPVLNRPDGPFHLAGEHLTYLGGWMAGAFESARAVVADLRERVAKTA